MIKKLHSYCTWYRLDWLGYNDHAYKDREWQREENCILKLNKIFTKNPLYIGSFLYLQYTHMGALPLHLDSSNYQTA